MLIFSYKPGSRSARSLSQELGARRIKHTGSTLRGNGNKTVINWGAANLPDEVMKCRVINRPDLVAQAGNKLEAFRRMSDAGVSVVPFTDSIDIARQWLADNKAVIGRQLLRGSGGRGIVMYEDTNDIDSLPLYTQYVKKQSEWRVHIMNGQVIDTQRKVRDTRVADDDVDWQIRNHDRGFIFQRNDINPPVQVIEESAKAMAALGLDFGAVDVIWNNHQQRAYILEVNTAPGLEGTTLQNYANAFREAV